MDAEEAEDLFGVFDGATPPAAPADGASHPVHAAKSALCPLAETTPVERSALTLIVPRPAVELSDGPDAAAASVRSGVVVEPQSGIRIRRATASYEQLHVWLSQSPYVTVAQARAVMAAPTGSRGDAAVIGVVSRKFDPKSGSRSRYAVVRVWDLRGPASSPEHELAVLLVGDAFEHYLHRLTVGIVVACRVQATGGDRSGGVADTAKDAGSDLLKVSTLDALRVLGHAADLGTCEATSNRSQERCQNLVNVAMGRFCSYHFAELRRVARGTVCSSRGTFTSMASAAKPLMVEGRHGAVARPHVSGAAAAPARSAEVLVQRQSSYAASRENFLLMRAPGQPLNPAGPQTHAISTGGDPAYAAVQRGAPLTIAAGPRGATTPSRSIARLGVTTRGRDVLAAAVQNDTAEQERRRLSQLLSGTAVVTEVASRSTAPTRPREPTGDRVPGVLKVRRTEPAGAGITDQQLPPLHAAPPSSFTPLSCRQNPLYEEVAVRRRAFESHIVTGCPSGPHSRTHALIQRVADAVRADKRLLTVAAKQPLASGGAGGRPAGRDGTTLLGRVADTLCSANDAVRVQSEADALLRLLDKGIEQEHALSVLAGISEQRVLAVHCYTCKRWYVKRPSDCVSAHHKLVPEMTVKRYIQCGHCRFKTSCLGEVLPALLLPKCPRCHAEAAWSASNAAPEIAEPKLIPGPR